MPENKVARCVFVLLVAALFLAATLVVRESPTREEYEVEPPPEPSPRNGSAGLKYILYYSPYFDREDWNFGFGRRPFVDYGCKVDNCYATNDRKMLGTVDGFDAVLFHLNNHKTIPDQRRRRRGQRYVMFLMESPHNTAFPFGSFPNFFNWTMSYRTDSDLPRPYGWTEPLPTESPESLEEFKRRTADVVRRKEKLVAWLVSNCDTHSEREDYVEELKRHVPVDVYGGCGSHECERSRPCYEIVASRYKFVLSFENSVCSGYATEKLWKVLDTETGVPVVLGGANYSALAPPNSFIDSKKFTPKGLAEHLLHLSRHPEQLVEHLAWKRRYRIDRRDQLVMCKLCEDLNDPNLPDKSYADIRDWYVTQGRCVDKGYHPWSKKKPSSLMSLVQKHIVDGLRSANVIV